MAPPSQSSTNQCADAAGATLQGPAPRSCAALAPPHSGADAWAGAPPGVAEGPAPGAASLPHRHPPSRKRPGWGHHCPLGIPTTPGSPDLLTATKDLREALGEAEMKGGSETRVLRQWYGTQVLLEVSRDQGDGKQQTVPLQPCLREGHRLHALFAAGPVPAPCVLRHPISRSRLWAPRQGVCIVLVGLRAAHALCRSCHPPHTPCARVERPRPRARQPLHDSRTGGVDELRSHHGRCAERVPGGRPVHVHIFRVDLA